MFPHCSSHSPDGGVFYRKQLTLKHPSSACEVKVISRSPCLPACLCLCLSFLFFSRWPFRRCPSCCLWVDAAAFRCAELSWACGRRHPARRAAPPSTCSRCRVWWRRWGPVCRQEPRTWWTWSVSSSWSVEMMAENKWCPTPPPLSPFHSLTLSLVSLQNQSSAVGGFLPLLMGGGLFSARMPPAGTPAPPLLADPIASLLSVNTTVLITHCPPLRRNRKTLNCLCPASTAPPALRPTGTWGATQSEWRHLRRLFLPRAALTTEWQRRR